MNAVVFEGGTVWTGTGTDTDAVLVVDGVVEAVGAEARGSVGAARVDLGGGFLMPSFGDGHAHPMLGGFESAGPPVRPCQSVAEIVEAVREFAERHGLDILTPMLTISRRLRCTACGERKAGCRPAPLNSHVKGGAR